MSEHTNPQFSDILNLLNGLPQKPQANDFQSDHTEPLSWLADWLHYHSRLYDFSRGFNVNRCALYWAGYDAVDGFDGEAFVQSCQDSKSGLRTLASILDTDLQIFEVEPQNHNQKTSDELALACSYGMMAIEESTQLFCATSFGQGVQASATKGLEAFRANPTSDIETFMVNNCGLDHAALLGNAIACTMKGIPFIVEGTQGTLVKEMLEHYTQTDMSHIIVTDDISPFETNTTVGHDLLSTAIFLKTLYVSGAKTSCGKFKSLAA